MIKRARNAKKRETTMDKLEVHLENMLKARSKIRLYREDELLGNVRVHDTHANILIIDSLTQSRPLKKEDILTLRYSLGNRDVELTGRFQKRDHFRIDRKTSIPVIYFKADEVRDTSRRKLLRIDFDGVPSELSLHVQVSLVRGEVFNKGSKLLTLQEIMEDGWHQCSVKDISGAGARIVGNELYASIAFTFDLSEKIARDVLNEINSRGGLLINLAPHISDKLSFRYDMPKSIKFIAKIVSHTVDLEREMVYYSVAFTHRVMTDENDPDACTLKDIDSQLGDSKVVQFISAVDYYLAKTGVAR